MRVRGVMVVTVVVLCIGVFQAASAWQPPSPGPDNLQNRVAALEAAVSTLQAQVAQLQANNALALGPYVSVTPGPVNGLRGPHVFFTGANVHVRSGSGSTSDNEASGGTLTGLGNLVVGYNEPDPTPSASRNGSHNLIVGPLHEYSLYGGLVAGFRNELRGRHVSVAGGVNNVASGLFASVSGGASNTAGPDEGASVSGGQQNTASGAYSSISGGLINSAVGGSASVSGGARNLARGGGSSVSGGERNSALGNSASVSGGVDRSAVDSFDWRAGTLLEDQ